MNCLLRGYIVMDGVKFDSMLLKTSLLGSSNYLADYYYNLSWIDRNGCQIKCVEKNKVMLENISSFAKLSIEIIEDAVLMNVDLQQIKNELINFIDSIEHKPS